MRVWLLLLMMILMLFGLLLIIPRQGATPCHPLRCLTAPAPLHRRTHTLARLQFHVDKLSSAHIYLRMQDGQSWDALPEALVADLAQLTKANSIEGSFFLSLSLAPPATTN